MCVCFGRGFWWGVWGCVFLCSLLVWQVMLLVNASGCRFSDARGRPVIHELPSQNKSMQQQPWLQWPVCKPVCRGCLTANAVTLLTLSVPAPRWRLQQCCLPSPLLASGAPCAGGQKRAAITCVTSCALSCMLFKHVPSIDLFRVLQPGTSYHAQYQGLKASSKLCNERK